MGTIVPNSQLPPGGADPVAAIAKLLDAERVTASAAQPAPAPVEDQQTGQPDVEPQPQGDDYQPDSNTQVEGGDAQPETTEIPLEQLEAIELELAYKAAGQDVTEKLPIKELKLGYMRQKDYQAKTAEVARQREEVAEKVRQGVSEREAQYLQHLQTLQAAFVESVAPELKSVDWNDLAANNPFEWARLKQKQDHLVQVLTAVQSKQKEITDKQKTERDQAMKAAVEKARQTVPSEIPGWSDAIEDSLKASGKSLGYSEDEVSAFWVDPRAIKLLHKAYLYDQMKVGKPPSEKKVVVTPKVITPGATSTVSPKAQQQQDAMKRLQQTGRIRDAAALIASRMR